MDIDRLNWDREVERYYARRNPWDEASDEEFEDGPEDDEREPYYGDEDD